MTIQYKHTLLFTIVLSFAYANICIGQKSDSPNILLVLTDDQGWWDLGIRGNQTLETPNLDKFAQEGMNFSHYYAAPVCSPTRAGMMTGRYHLRTGLYNTRFGGDAIDKEEITVAELLQQAGYRTGLIGKWHLGKYYGYTPNQQGFDEFFGHYYGHIEEYDYPDQLVHNGKPVESRKYVTDLFTEAAIHFMGSTQDQPFFCYLAYNAPHSPWVVGTSHNRQKRGDALIAKYLDRGCDMRNARIYAMVEIVDENFGRIMDYLDSTDQVENTIVLFASDNGGVSNHFKGVLNGQKGSVYEGGVRAPLLVRWPDKIGAASRQDAMISHVDLMPTLCEIAGVDIPEDRKIDGKSIWPLLNGETNKSPHTYLYHHWDRYFPNPHNIWAITDGRYKLLRNLSPWEKEPDMLPEPAGELYDLLKDPSEKNNVASDHPQKVKELRDEFLSWFDEVTNGRKYQPIPIPVGHPEENPVEIQPSWAKLHGPNVDYTFLGYDWDTIDKLISKEDRASWNLDIKQKGRYEVMISYSNGNVVKEGSISISNGQEELAFSPELTPGFDTFHQASVGVLQLETGLSSISVSVNEATGYEVLKLNKIWLRKIIDPSH